ncbi:MAG: glutamine-hydrolyzing GMP synthase, partial [Pseudomonadota bacterium]
MKDTHAQKSQIAHPAGTSILIVDFGSQVTQLIARRLREIGVYCEIHPYNRVDQSFISEFSPGAIILSGGPASLSSALSPRPDKAVFDRGVPILGICYGEQAICSELGGDVSPSDHREFGRANIDVVAESALFGGVWQPGQSYPVWMSHGDRVDSLPAGFKTIATSEGAPFAAIADEGKRIYGVQFHPEVAHTPDGSAILRNFVVDIANIKPEWTMAAFKDEAIRQIREQVGDKKVVCGLSGGVDSSVAAVLIHEAIGEQLTCIYVDTGLMRAGESDQVVSLFRQHYNIPLIHENAEELFLGKLAGVDDPEKKRKIIGATFIDVFEEKARGIG